MKGERVIAVALAVAVMCFSGMPLFAQEETEPTIVAYFTRGDFSDVLVRPQYPPEQVVIVEPEGEFAEIDVAKTNAMMRKLLYSEPSEREAILSEITSNHGRYAPTALYLAASAMFELADKDEATFWFYVAQVRARSDAMRIKNPNAHEAVGALNEMFGAPINEHAFQDWQKLKATAERVVAWDRQHERDYDPRWIALHGMTLYSGTKIPIEPEQRWAEINEECRKAWLNDFHQMIKSMEEADRDGDGQLDDAEKAAYWQELMKQHVLEQYEKTKDGVTYEGHALEGIDVATFQTLDDPNFAKDQSHVYVGGYLIEGADVATFIVIKGPYSKDKSNLYCGTVKMDVPDASALEVVYWEGMWQTMSDKQQFVFEFGESLKKLDVSADRPALIGQAWARDGASYYYGPARVEGADYDSFEVLDGFDAKDKHRLYNGAIPADDWPRRRREILGMRGESAASPDAVAVYKQGRNADDEGNLDQAVALFSRAIELDPSFSLAYRYRADAWSDKGEIDKAIADYSEAIRLDPKDAKAYNDRGVDRRQKGEHDKAIEDYSQAIELDPTYALAYRNRADAWSDKGETDKAIADYSEAIRLNPKNTTAYINRGVDRSAKGEHDKAIDDYSQAIELDPTYALAYRNRAVAWLDKGEYDKAIADYGEIIRIAPEDHSAYFHRGRAHRRAGQIKLAIADYTKAIELKPNSEGTFNNRGSAWQYLGELDKAVADFTKAIEIAPEFALAYKNRAGAFRQKSMLERALSDFDKAIQLAPKDAIARNDRGIVRQTKGDYSEALADFAEAVELAENDRFHNNLAWLMATCPDPKFRDGQRALVEAQTACELTNWKDASNLDTLAAACAESGDFEQAVKWMNRAIELGSEKYLPRFRDRLALYQMGKPFRIHSLENPASANDR